MYHPPMYLLIHPDGTLTERHGLPTGERLRDDLGEPRGKDRVPLGWAPDAAGWVNGDGHYHPDKHPRNVVGSAVLASLGATPYPYAGTVAITGWHPQFEITELSWGAANVIRRVYHDVLAALSYGVDFTGTDRDQWARWARGYAGHVITAPVVPYEMVGRP